MLNTFYTHYPQDNLCLSGGCAYNGLANGKITIETPYKNVYVPPAPSDAGSAIGCALFVYYQSNPTQKRVENSNPFLGPSYGAADFITAIAKLVPKEKVKRFENYHPLIEHVADLINSGAIIGWFQDGSEFGQRALGHRSILANPTIPDIKPKVNRVIKKREGFRPFAPMVTLDDANILQVYLLLHMLMVRLEFRRFVLLLIHIFLHYLRNLKRKVVIQSYLTPHLILEVKQWY